MAAGSGRAGKWRLICPKTTGAARIRQLAVPLVEDAMI